MKTAEKKKPAKGVAIPPMQVTRTRFDLVGSTPLVQRPLVVRKKKGCEFYVSPEGWRGIPVYGIKQSIIGACKLEGLRFGVKFLSGMISVRADGFDVVEGTPLVKITNTKGGPRSAVGHGSKIPKSAWGSLRDSGKLQGALAYPAGWEARVVVEFDSDALSLEQIAQVMITAGAQVGLGYLRPDAHKKRKTDPCFDFGTFEVSV